MPDEDRSALQEHVSQRRLRSSASVTDEEVDEAIERLERSGAVDLSARSGMACGGVERGTQLGADRWRGAVGAGDGVHWRLHARRPATPQRLQAQRSPATP